MKPLDSYYQLSTEFYDLEKPQATAEELAWYMEYALQANGPILEPMCGTGRYIIPMLEKGLDVEGFDASEHMLQTLAQKCAQKNITPTMRHCFFQEFNSERRYAFIFVPSGSFGLITNLDDVKHCLQVVHAHLAPQGKFVFEVDTPQAITATLNEWNRSTYTKSDGTQIIGHQRPAYNTKTQIITITCHYEHKQSTELLASQSEKIQLRLYKRYEIDALLREFGFSFVTYKAHHKIPANEFDSTLVYECTIK
jgi:SAM-dependent methyltransferase